MCVFFHARLRAAHLSLQGRTLRLKLAVVPAREVALLQNVANLILALLRESLVVLAVARVVVRKLLRVLDEIAPQDFQFFFFLKRGNNGIYLCARV